MATLQSFEEIEAWQKARELTRAVCSCSGAGAFAKDFALRDQIRRARWNTMTFTESITAEQMILGATPMSGSPEVPHDID